ncbi:MAG: FAD-dependent oxidoreductase [Xanthomonadales bacterium]|nr:FAD-dependent oxidoreductase [Xanthomonadales bacterium]
MRIAVVGSGIAGLGAAWLLQRRHQVTLFEAEDRLGGHTHTHAIEADGREYQIDTGFIVFNPQHYPLLSQLFSELGVASQPTTMSFSVSDERSGLEYECTDLAGLYCQKRNLLRPRFARMLWDLTRFYRLAPALLQQPEPGPTLGEYLQQHRFGPGFVHDHLLPMAAALWSSPERQILEFPARALVQFMANHCMLQISGRPPWQVVQGGSSSYLRALEPRLEEVDIRLASPVVQVRRLHEGVEICTSDRHGGQRHERFDQVVLACHSDQALRMLEQPSAAEHEVLNALPFERNDVVLHTDVSLLPRRRRAWAAWNALKLAGVEDRCTVSYSMNLLQSLPGPTQFVVTLNGTDRIDPARILRRLDYAHPIYTIAGARARARRAEINGVDRIWYCGAYWGHGFHEDGLRSGVKVAQALGVQWPGNQ